MKAKIDKNKLIINFPNPTQQNWTTEVIDRKNNERKVVTFFDRVNKGDIVEISTNFDKFNPITHRLEIDTGEDRLILDEAFDHYRIDLSNIDNHAYMTKNLFGAGLRSLNHDDIFYLSYCHLNIIPIENQFYGGLITLLCFRISEDLSNRSLAIDDILSSYRRMGTRQPLRPDHSVRWRISSAVNLAILLCYLERESEAHHVIEQAISQPHYNGIFPLTHMNYATLLNLSAMFAVKYGDRKLAYMRFSECSNYCSHSVSDLFNLRNNYYFQHEMDVRTLIDTGYQSSIAMAILSNDRHPGDSKMTFNKKSVSTNNLSFNHLFSRFISIIGNPPRISNDIKKLLIK